jgi:hypothetical protein
MRIEPIDHILAAMAPGRAGRRTDAQVHLAPRQEQVFGDLAARLATAHHQHGTRGKLAWVAVVAGIELEHGAGRRSARGWRFGR